MNDILTLPTELGQAIQQARKTQRQKATDIARRAGRARDVLYRLERGDDVTVASLLDILRAMGLGLRLERSGLPTLQEMRERFARDDAGDENAAPDHDAA